MTMPRPAIQTAHYLFEQTPLEYAFTDIAEPLTLGDAVRRLIEHHFGDAENNLVLPEPGETEQEVLRRAEVVGITQVRLIDG